MVSAGGNRRRVVAREAILVVMGLVLVSIAIRLLDLDRRVSEAFFQAGRSPEWWGKGRSLWEAVYDAAVWPANVVASIALLALLASLIRPVLRPHRRTCAMLVLTLALGPGLVVNGILKPEIGRPRPRDIVEFGGIESFRSIGSIDLSGDGKSFPSGHASMGFYFLVLYVLWRRSRPRAARAALAAGLAGGVVIGFQRIAVGAHFLSDVIWSGGVVYLVVLFLDAALPVPRDGRDSGGR
jgi:lipid A 4'-phosphatase